MGRGCIEAWESLLGKITPVGALFRIEVDGVVDWASFGAFGSDFSGDSMEDGVRVCGVGVFES